MTSVEGYIVKPSTLSEDITASGTLLSAEETELHPEASGRVTYINLPEGKTVRKGQLLLKVFDGDLKTQLQKLESQKKQAEITEQRLGELLKVKGVSQQEYDLASLQVQTLNSEMELVRINAKTELRAPYDGIIGLRKISPGAYVTPTTAVTTIRAATALKLDFSVPEKYSAFLRPARRFPLPWKACTTPHTATVLATEQSITAETRNLQVRATVKGSSRDLLPGAFAQVNLSLGNKPDRAADPQPGHHSAGPRQKSDYQQRRQSDFCDRENWHPAGRTGGNYRRHSGGRYGSRDRDALSASRDAGEIFQNRLIGGLLTLIQPQPGSQICISLEI